MNESKPFVIHSEFKPTGDQPTAIKELVKGLNDGKRYQVLLGATGTGKTFTMANVIEKVQLLVRLLQWLMSLKRCNVQL